MVKTNKYVPTGVEISQAIAVSLKQYDGPVNAKVVHQMLADANPTWRLPERRVNKFLKRYLNNDKNPANADDDETITSQPKSPKKRSSIVKPFAKLFGRKSSQKKLSPQKVPVVPDILGPEPTPEEEPNPAPESAPVMPEPVVEEKAIEAYEDDNNPSEREKCECNACVVM